MANAVTNFLNGVANGTKSVILDPIVDIGSTTVKGIAGGTAALAGKDSTKIRENIDKAASQLKGEMQQPKQADSIAYAIGEGLPVGVDNAAGAVGLGMLAKQLPKAAQKGWKAILDKVNKADTPAKQKAVVNEARDYVNKHVEINNNLSKRMYNQSREVPAYQQRAYAAENPGMAKYKTNAAEVNFSVTKDGNTTTPLGPMFSYDNSLKQKLTPDMASQLGIPYGGKNMKNVQRVQKEVQNLAKMSDKDFKEMMQSNSSASWAGYGDWRYDLGEDWMNNWNNPKAYPAMKKQIIDNILNDAGLNYGVAETYGDAIKANAVKSSKRYRNWLKKEAKNTYEKNTQPITRAERNAADVKSAEIEKKKIMDQYGISSKDYDEYADAAANTYIYVDKNGNPVNQMAGAGWPGGGEYFIDEKAEVMPYLKGYARRHPTVDEYIRMADEERELSRLAEEEAEDIAREAGPAYDSDRYLNWL